MGTLKQHSSNKNLYTFLKGIDESSVNSLILWMTNFVGNENDIPVVIHALKTVCLL